MICLLFMNDHFICNPCIFFSSVNNCAWGQPQAHRLSMDTYRNTKKSMDIHGHPWISMDIHGHPWISMDICRNPSIYTDIHGYRWISWISMDIYRLPWIYIRISMEINRFPAMFIVSKTAMFIVSKTASLDPNVRSF